MDIEKAQRYLKIRRLAENNPSAQEAQSARTRLSAMEAENPNLPRAAALLEQIEQDRFEATATASPASKTSIWETILSHPLVAAATAIGAAELGKGIGLFLEKAQPIDPKKKYDVLRIDDENHSFLFRLDPEATERQVQRALRRLAEMIEEAYEEAEDEDEDDTWDDED